MGMPGTEWDGYGIAVYRTEGDGLTVNRTETHWYRRVPVGKGVAVYRTAKEG